MAAEGERFEWGGRERGAQLHGSEPWFSADTEHSAPRSPTRNQQPSAA